MQYSRLKTQLVSLIISFIRTSVRVTVQFLIPFSATRIFSLLELTPWAAKLTSCQFTFGRDRSLLATPALNICDQRPLTTANIWEESTETSGGLNRKSLFTLAFLCQSVRAQKHILLIILALNNFCFQRFWLHFITYTELPQKPFLNFSLRQRNKPLEEKESAKYVPLENLAIGGCYTEPLFQQ